MTYTIKYQKENNTEVEVYYSFYDLLEALKELSRNDLVNIDSIEIITT